MTSPKAVEKTRRIPRRRRSQGTVETIFEATAHILQKGGALNTNRIAERAGVSIGSLYAYFPNKEAILLAMGLRELDRLRDAVIEALMTRTGAPPMRLAVRALVAGYGDQDRSRRILMETLYAHGQGDEITDRARAVAEMLRGQVPVLPGGRALTDVDLFVLTRAVDSVVRAAIYEGAGFARSASFEDAVVRLAESYLAP